MTHIGTEAIVLGNGDLNALLWERKRSLRMRAINSVQATDRRQDVPGNKGEPAAMPAKTSKSKDQKPLRFIFITTCVGEDFFKPVKKGMNDAAGLMNVECDFVGTEEADLQAQAQMVRKAVADGYDGIALNIIHATVLYDLFLSCSQAAIKNYRNGTEK